MLKPLSPLHQAPLEHFTSFFVFPFTFKQKPNLSRNSSWQRSLFEIPKKKNDMKEWIVRQNYAEYIYFHDYVRSFLFPEQTKENSAEFWKFQLPEITLVQLEYYKDKKDQKFIKDLLKAFINGVYLHLFPGKIGVLVIETANRPDTDEKFCLERNLIAYGSDLLLFHNMFRRVYPAYFEKDGALRQQKDNEYPLSVRIEPIQGHKAGWPKKYDNSDESNIIEKIYLKPTSNSDNYYPAADSFVTDLLDDVFITKSGRAAWCQHPKPYTPILDDRMLVFNYTAFPENWKSKRSLADRTVFFSHLLWVDNPETDFRYDANFVKQLLDKHTYKRWSHFGTMIGFSRYSGAFLYFGHAEFLYRPFVSMYYQMFILIVFYRARLIRFSDEVSKIAVDFPIGKRQSKTKYLDFLTKLRELHSRFMKFMNIYWFREVTNQDQGIELFKLMRDAFELDTMYDQVKDEIERADQLVEMIHNEKVAEFSKKAGVIGAIIGAMAVVSGFFGINLKFITNTWVKSDPLFCSVSVLCAALFFVIILSIMNKK